MEQTTSSPRVQPPQPEFAEPIPAYQLRELLQRAQSGDSLAFARLYGFYWGRVFAYARSNLGDDQAAEDLAARIYLAAWRSVRCCEPEREPFGAWLYLIARRELVDFARGRGAAPVKEIVSPSDEGFAPFGNDAPCPES